MDEQLSAGATNPESTSVEIDEAAAASLQRRNAAAIFGVVLVVLIAIVAFAFAPKGRPVGDVLPNDPAGYALPALTLDRVDGEGQLSLSDYAGQPLVINFWGAWCDTCKLEAEILGNAERKWRERGVVFIGIDSKDTTEAAQAFEDEYGIDYLSMVDAEGAIAAQWGVTGFPETFFVDQDGRIAYKFISSIDEASLDANISAILN